MSLQIKQQVQEYIHTSQSILIPLPESNWQDSLGSALALAYILNALGKVVKIIVPEGARFDFVDFLPIDMVSDFIDGICQSVVSIDITKCPISELKYDKTDDRLNIYLTPELINLSEEWVSINKGRYQYDLIILLNTASWDHLGDIFLKNTELFYETASVSISSHSHTEYARVNWIDPSCSSVSEILFDFIKAFYHEQYTGQVATALLFGMISETQNFQSNMTTPKTFTYAAELMEYGADQESIIRVLYKSNPVRILKLLGRVMSHMEIIDMLDVNQSRLVCSRLYQHDFSKTGTTREDMDLVLRELQEHLPQNISGIHIMFETGGKVKEGLIYTKNNLNQIKAILDGEVYRGIFRYTYPSENDVHQACDEVNQKLRQL